MADPMLLLLGTGMSWRCRLFDHAVGTLLSLSGLRAQDLVFRLQDPEPIQPWLSGIDMCVCRTEEYRQHWSHPDPQLIQGLRGRMSRCFGIDPQPRQVSLLCRCLSPTPSPN